MTDDPDELKTANGQNVTLSDLLELYREALMFYANSDNYWSAPLDLNGNYDRRTLQAVTETKKHNKVLADWGEKARIALSSNAK